MYENIESEHAIEYNKGINTMIIQMYKGKANIDVPSLIGKSA